VPPDEKLRQRLVAHYIAKTTDHVVTVWDENAGAWVSEKKSLVPLVDTDEVKRRRGCSPDLADAFVLAPCEPGNAQDEGWEVW